MATALLFAFLMSILSPMREGWIVPQPKANVWTTLVKALNQSGLCLSLSSAKDPISTCLVGIPLQPNEYLFMGKKPDPVHSWDSWTKIYPHAPQEPQELALVGSAKAVYCINFDYKLRGRELYEANVKRKPFILDVTPNNQI